MKPGGTAARAGLAQLLILQGETAEGIRRLKELAAEQPDNVALRLALLRRPEIQRNWDEAQQLINEIRRAEGDRGVIEG